MHQKQYLSTKSGAEDAKQPHTSAKLHAAGADELMPRQLHCQSEQQSALRPASKGVTGLTGLASVSDKGPGRTQVFGDMKRAGPQACADSDRIGLQAARLHRRLDVSTAVTQGLCSTCLTSVRQLADWLAEASPAA